MFDLPTQSRGAATNSIVVRIDCGQDHSCCDWFGMRAIGIKGWVIVFVENPSLQKGKGRFGFVGWHQYYVIGADQSECA